MSGRRAAAAVVTVLAVGLSSGGCSLFSRDKTNTVSVFDVTPGQCFTAIPADQIKAELADLPRVECSAPHTMEAYAIVPYAATDGSQSGDYPGVDTLGKFAQGRCAQEFTGYVGISYLDSQLYFTYLMPSARSWAATSRQGDDRSVICFVTTTGEQLTASVKGSKR